MESGYPVMSTSRPAQRGDVLGWALRHADSARSQCPGAVTQL